MANTNVLEKSHKNGPILARPLLLWQIAMQSLPDDRQEKLPPPSCSPRSTRKALASAFASFNQAAGALETTYVKLQAEVGGLRQELESKNRSLALSLEENQRMRSYLARIVESLPCGVLVFDEGMNLRIANPAASRLLSSSGDGLLRPEQSIFGLIGPLLAGAAVDGGSREQEWVLNSGQGDRTLGVTRARLQSTGTGEDTILILRDLTESKQLEREREASRRSQALAEVAALLAHEIRNPLGSLELFAGLLADAVADQPGPQSWINHIQAGLRSLAATVNNVLNFHAQPIVQLLPVDLPQLVADTVEFLRPLARQKAMHITCRAPSDPVIVRADSSRLRQAFLNLALNAFRAMKPEGTLSISLGCKGQGANAVAVVSFADQGTGIPAENLERIFEPGFSTQSGSPGLGLAVTRRVLEEHGGTVNVQSCEGQGTTFAIDLPLAKCELKGRIR